MARPLLLVLGAIAAIACHAQRPAAAPGSSRNVITQEQIDASSASNVYDLIARLRGDFLKDRGPTSIKSNTRERAVVFLNDQEYGILETMRNIPPGRIAEIRYYSPIDAAARFGAHYGGGVIHLLSRTQ